MTISYCEKNVVLQLLSFMFLWNGCTDTKQSAANIIAVDVTQIHSEKMLNGGEEVVSFECIPLETNDKFLCSEKGDGNVVSFTDEVIVYRNFRSGDILIFDRKGRALKKINRKGRGPEEYQSNMNIVYDETGKELFVNDAACGKIMVYDLDGNFKRSFPNNSRAHWSEMENYDKESLLRYVRDENVESPLFLISKQTGEKIRDIIIPYKKRLFAEYQRREGNRIISGSPIGGKRLIRYGKEFLIFEPSSDTIYNLNPQKSVLYPVLYRTPPIQTMDIPVILLPTGKVGNFLFLTCLKIEDDSKTNDSWVYDCRHDKFYDMLFFPKIFGTNNIEVVHENRNNVWLVTFPAHKAIEWKEGEEGELKKIAAYLKEDDNPVIIIVTLKE